MWILWKFKAIYNTSSIKKWENSIIVVVIIMNFVGSGHESLFLWITKWSWSLHHCFDQQPWTATELATEHKHLFNFLSRRYPQFGLYPCIFSTIFIRFNLPLVSELPCLSNLVKPNNSSHKKHICAITNFWNFFSLKLLTDTTWEPQTQYRQCFLTQNN